MIALTNRLATSNQAVWKAVLVLIAYCATVRLAHAQSVLPAFIDKLQSLESQTFWDNKDWDWYLENIPFFECPDPELTKTYLYRWELVTKHLTYGSPDTGYIFTEFIDRPFWSGTYGAISCPAGHQLYEVRWLRDAQYAHDYARYWFRTPGAQPRRYSTWLADAIWAVHQVHPDPQGVIELLPDLKANYAGWEQDHFDPALGLFWQTGHDDGMETNINSRQTEDWFRGAPGYRPTLNSYLWADAHAIARIADLAGDAETAKTFRSKANELKERMQKKLWDPQREFFFHMNQHADVKEGHRVEAQSLTYQSGKYQGSSQGRELIGYVPWQFQLPDAGFETAWKFLMDPNYFLAPYGPTTVGRHDPLFVISPHCCVWSGQSWPYATSQTLKAMAHLLQYYPQSPITRRDYLQLLNTYSLTHRKAGQPYLAEAAHPDTGSWEGHDAYNHSEHYFHSSFNDLIITGLIGLIPRDDDQMELRPLAPDTWDYFALVDLPYRGHQVSILWDRSGARYGQGAGLQLFVDGQRVAAQATLQPMTARLPVNKVTSRERVTTGLAGSGESKRRVNYAVNNDGGYYPRIAGLVAESDQPLSVLIDGNYWYHISPPNRWTSVGIDEREIQLSIDFGTVRPIDRISLYWLDDGPDLPPPVGALLDFWTGSVWQPIKVNQRKPDRPLGRRAQQFHFQTIRTERIRVRFEPSSEKPAGLSEIEVWGEAVGEVKPVAAPQGNLALAMPGQAGPKISASHTSQFDQIEMANDGQVSFRPSPHNRWTSYESSQTSDWLMLEWEQPHQLGRVEIAVYDDRGGVRAPSAMTVETWNGTAWEGVRDAIVSPRKPVGGQWNEIRFAPVQSTRLRVVFQHADNAKSGVSEILVWSD